MNYTEKLIESIEQTKRESLRTLRAIVEGSEGRTLVLSDYIPFEDVRSKAPVEKLYIGEAADMLYMQTFAGVVDSEPENAENEQVECILAILDYIFKKMPYAALVPMLLRGLYVDLRRRQTYGHAITNALGEIYIKLSGYPYQQEARDLSRDLVADGFFNDEN